MIAIREKTKVQKNGALELHNPALTEGDDVEVIVLLPSKKPGAPNDPYGFLKVLENAKLDGPPDWSGNLDDYLYHGKSHDRQ